MSVSFCSKPSKVASGFLLGNPLKGAVILKTRGPNDLVPFSLEDVKLGGSTSGNEAE